MLCGLLSAIWWVFQVKYKHKYRYISSQASYALTPFGLTTLSALTDYIVPQERKLYNVGLGDKTITQLNSIINQKNHKHSSAWALWRRCHRQRSATRDADETFMAETETRPLTVRDLMRDVFLTE